MKVSFKLNGSETDLSLLICQKKEETDCDSGPSSDNNRITRLLHEHIQLCQQEFPNNYCFQNDGEDDRR